MVIYPYLLQEGKLNLRGIKEERNIKNDKIKIVYNKNRNPVYNNVEFFECQSQLENEMEEEDSSFNNELFNEKLLIGKNKNNINNRDKEYENIMGNIVFELEEEKVNTYKCSECFIF